MAPTIVEKSIQSLEKPVGTVNGQTVTRKHVLYATIALTLFTAGTIGLTRWYKRRSREARREKLKNSIDYQRAKVAESLMGVKKDMNETTQEIKLTCAALDKIEKRKAKGRRESSSSSSSSSSDEDEQGSFVRRKVRELRREGSIKLRKRLEDASQRLHHLAQKLDSMEEPVRGEVVIEEIVETHTPDGKVTTTKTTRTESAENYPDPTWTDKLRQKRENLRSRISNELESIKARISG
jgi:uncharacterized protein YbjQ (UPF0145 family)